MTGNPGRARGKNMSTMLRITSILTGLLLIPVAYLATLSGVCIRLPGAVSRLTLGLLEGYAECHRLHLEALPMLLAPLLVVHVAASLELALAPLRGQGPVLTALAWAVRGVAWVLGGVLLAGVLLYYW